MATGNSIFVCEASQSREVLSDVVMQAMAYGERVTIVSPDQALLAQVSEIYRKHEKALAFVSSPEAAEPGVWRRFEADVAVSAGGAPGAFGALVSRIKEDINIQLGEQLVAGKKAWPVRVLILDGLTLGAGLPVMLAQSRSVNLRTVIRCEPMDLKGDGEELSSIVSHSDVIEFP